MTAGTILRDLTGRGIRIWVTGDRLKLDAPAGSLTGADLADLRARKAELLSALSKPGTCPACREPMDLQDKARDCWWCPGCRKFLRRDGLVIPPPPKTKPLTRERHEAQRLLADLQAAGCAITARGGEVAISNLANLLNELFRRLEEADWDFVYVALQLANLNAI